MDCTFSHVEMNGLKRLFQRDYIQNAIHKLCISGCVHLTKQTAFFVEQLHLSGAYVKWCSCNPLSVQNDVVEYLTGMNIDVFGYYGSSEEEYWRFIDLSLHWHDKHGDIVLVDDGGDLLYYLVCGFRVEKGAISLSSIPRDAIRMNIEYSLDNSSSFFSSIYERVIGVTEQTTTGASRLHKYYEGDDFSLRFPSIDVNSSVTKCKFDNFYGSRESIVSSLKKSTNMTLSGKRVAVLGFGAVGKGCAYAMKSCGCLVYVTEIDPICALQAYMDGFHVVKIEDIVDSIDIFITATGNYHVITHDHMLSMKDKACICNIGHFDKEIDIDCLEDKVWKEICHDVHSIDMNNGKSIILFARGRLVNLVCGDGHPSLVMSMTFANQLIAIVQIVHWKNKGHHGVYSLTKGYDEEIAKCHLYDIQGCNLTVLNDKQSEYIGVDKKGPFKKPGYLY